jgi:hypothetical protein
MNIINLAKRAGFIFWEDEPYKPFDLQLGIDWSSDYDDQLIAFAALVRTQTLEEAALACEDHFLSDGNWCAEQIRKLK